MKIIHPPAILGKWGSKGNPEEPLCGKGSWRDTFFRSPPAWDTFSLPCEMLVSP